ncbi:MAG: cysteine desulfurase [Gammaproteobacteria bacterium]|nr:cysteine desulfurase [Gammaproteobacteria bacterium]
MIYFDHNASTPVHPDVLAEMMPYLQSCYANPSSVHKQGRVAREAIDKAREQVAQLVNAHPSQVIFTSGGTEANNLAIKGSIRGMGISRLVTGATEHPSVRDVSNYFAASTELNVLSVDEQGLINIDELSRFSSSKIPTLISVMMANNETGVIQDIASIAARFKNDGHIFHTDAVQAAGKIKVDFGKLNVNLMSLSAHKIYGPKGIGALIFDKCIDLEPMMHGGGQEKKRRSGTENVAAIVGFGKAAELARLNIESNAQEIKNLQVYFEDQLQQLNGVVIFSEKANRLNNTTFFGLPGIDGETLLMQLDAQGVAVTSGSACASTSLAPSHVLMAMGVSEQIARSAIRVSFGLQNTKAEIDQLIYILKMQIEMISSLEILEF